MPTDATDVSIIEESLLSLARILFVGQESEQILQQVADLAQRLVPGAESVSVTVVLSSKPLTTVFTSGMARAIDQHQYDNDEGPCLDAMRHNQVIQVPSYARELRWPTLTPQARQEGAASSLSLPLTTAEGPLGALNMYSGIEDGFDSATPIATTFATHAAVVLANAAALARATELAGQLNIALERRDMIGQAKGILIAESKMSSDEAFEVLRRASQRSNRKLYDVAVALVQRHAVTPAGTAP